MSSPQDRGVAAGFQGAFKGLPHAQALQAPQARFSVFPRQLDSDFPAGSGAVPALQICLRRNRKELLITDTELKLMATAAIIGDSSRPKKG